MGSGVGRNLPNKQEVTHISSTGQIFKLPKSSLSFQFRRWQKRWLDNRCELIMYAYVAWTYSSDALELCMTISFVENDDKVRVKPTQDFKLSEMHSGENFKRCFPGSPRKIHLHVNIT